MEQKAPRAFFGLNHAERRGRKATGRRKPMRQPASGRIEQQLFVKLQEHLGVELLHLKADVIQNSAIVFHRLVAMAAQPPRDHLPVIWQRRLMTRRHLAQRLPVVPKADDVSRVADLQLHGIRRLLNRCLRVNIQQLGMHRSAEQAEHKARHVRSGGFDTHELGSDSSQRRFDDEPDYTTSARRSATPRSRLRCEFANQ
jgi:hypothetical protein